MRELEVRDSRLVELCLGDAGRRDPAFAELVRRYDCLVRSIAARNLETAGIINGHDLNDATQVVWLVVFNVLARFDRSRSFKSWVAGVARMSMRAYRRSCFRRRRSFGQLEDDGDADAVEQVPAEHEVDIETAEAVRALASGLAARGDRVLAAMLASDCSTGATAAACGCSQQTVRRRLRKFSGALRDVVFEGMPARDALDRCCL